MDVDETNAWLEELLGFRADGSRAMLGTCCDAGQRPSASEGEVPCCKVVGLAKALVKDGVGASQSQLIEDLSKIKEKDAEGKTHDVLSKHALTLPIPIREIFGKPELEGFPRLKPIDFLHYMAESGHLNKLLGGRSIAASGRILLQFWQNFKGIHPDFELWDLVEDSDINLADCIPIHAHMDGGRGYKKSESKGTADVDEALEEAPSAKRRVISGHDGPLRMADFDFAARRFLGELRSRDRADGGARFSEAMDMVLKYTSTKDRSSVRKWTAYAAWADQEVQMAAIPTYQKEEVKALAEHAAFLCRKRSAKVNGRPRISNEAAEEMSLNWGAEDAEDELYSRAPRSSDSVASVLFVVSSSAAAWVVGKAGRTVNELRAKSGASLEVARTGGPLRIIEIRGSSSERRKAVELLLDTIQELPASPPRETQLLAPPSAVLEMSRLQHKTNARVQVEKLGPEGADGFGTGSGCRLIILSGPREAVKEAALQAAAMLGQASTHSAPTASMQATCSNCGALFDDDAAFCKKCGHKRAEARRSARSVSPVPSVRALSVGAAGRRSSLPSSDGETQLLKALLAGPMPQTARLELLLPGDFVRLCLESGSHLQTVALRTGSHVELAPPGPEPMRMVTVSGTMLANSVAVLQLQELLQQYQGF
ncbi:unnamed protein product [Durusdinium trenchii]|uniref:K Homology domain-containing protein n=1 Tax=Durusdinium trenchii TaxID=1381693 RepID=A0ABP0MKR1_9DINO